MMYNEHYQFEKSPFRLTPDLYFFCQLQPHEEAFKTLLISLEQEEGFIKITGPVGTGKTMLCRQLMSQLDDGFAVAYIPNPALPVLDLYKMIIGELKGKLGKQADHAVVFQTLNLLLLELKKQGKRAVLLIDEAQTVTDEGLEAIRLLTNLEMETGKLLQVVLFGQPELDMRLNQPRFLPLKQRILFSYRLTPLNHAQFLDYVAYRIGKAGYSNQPLFDQHALKAIFKASRGIPRVINILCHKALIAAYAQGERCVTQKNVHVAIQDTLDRGRLSDKIGSWVQSARVNDWWVLGALFSVLIAVVCFLWLRSV